MTSKAVSDGVRGGYVNPAEMEAITEAENSLLSELKQGAMDPRALRERAIAHAESRGDVSLAFWRLLNRGEIVLTEDRTVRLAS